MAKRPIPGPEIPLVDDKGRVTQPWYEYIKNIGIANLSDVSTTAPTNNQVLIYNSTTGKYTPGSN